MNRKDVFWSKEIKHGEAGNMKLLRLMAKKSGKWERKVHETFITSKKQAY